MGLFTPIKALDATGKRGKRTVAVGMGLTQGLHLLEQFRYTPQCVVRQVLPFEFCASTTDWALILSDFDNEQIGFVAGATRIALVCFFINFVRGKSVIRIQFVNY